MKPQMCVLFCDGCVFGSERQDRARAAQQGVLRMLLMGLLLCVCFMCACVTFAGVV